MRKYLVALAALTLASSAAWADNMSNHPMKDSYITSKVKAELIADHDTKARDIHVATVDGVVTLRGTARSDAEKDRAERDALRVKGVRAVHNHIKVLE
jgi:hyperosmotically inducible periplasmic protein